MKSNNDFKKEHSLKMNNALKRDINIKLNNTPLKEFIKESRILTNK